MRTPSDHAKHASAEHPSNASPTRRRREAACPVGGCSANRRIKSRPNSGAAIHARVLMAISTVDALAASATAMVSLRGRIASIVVSRDGRRELALIMRRIYVHECDKMQRDAPIHNMLMPERREASPLGKRACIAVVVRRAWIGESAPRFIRRDRRRRYAERSAGAPGPGSAIIRPSRPARPRIG